MNDGTGNQQSTRTYKSQHENYEAEMKGMVGDIKNSVEILSRKITAAEIKDEIVLTWNR